MTAFPAWGWLVVGTIGFCLLVFGMTVGVTVGNVQRLRPWQICRKCERTVRIGNSPALEEGTVCEECKQAA